MGIEDRDYMRERHRERSARAGRTVWNDARSRVELGSSFRAHPAQKWIFGLGAVLALIPFVMDAKRSGWLPDLEQSIPFPKSGSVTISADLDPKTAISKFRVTTKKANAVVQLLDPSSGRHIISIYVERNDSVTVPVPSGTFRVNIIEGNKWHGPKRFFGSSTAYETVAQNMTVEPGWTRGIDLHRTVNGNLKTKLNITDPEPLL
nr:hypothetical protein [Sphingomonas xinjiangensis]